MTATVIKTAEAPKVSQHFGNVGDRIVLDGVCVANFGRLWVIADRETGNEFRITTGRNLCKGRGYRVVVEATITEHEIYVTKAGAKIARTVLANFREFVPSLYDKHKNEMFPQ